MSICTAYLPYRYVERWGGCADECHEIVIWQASPRCGINSLSHLSLMSWTDIYRVTRCVLGRSGVTAAGIYALRLLKAGCASSAVGSLRPLCDGCRTWISLIDIIIPIAGPCHKAVPCFHPLSCYGSMPCHCTMPRLDAVSCCHPMPKHRVLPLSRFAKASDMKNAIMQLCIGVAIPTDSGNSLILRGKRGGADTIRTTPTNREL